MQLEENAVIITYGNSHRLHEHLVADLVSSYLLRELAHGDQQVARSSTTHGARLGKSRLRNSYFDSLVDKLEDCIEDPDLRLAAIIPAYMHYDMVPDEPPPE